jgi:hypothetical protein
VTAQLGAERSLELRETQPFFSLRNEILHIIRHETQDER